MFWSGLFLLEGGVHDNPAVARSSLRWLIILCLDELIDVSLTGADQNEATLIKVTLGWIKLIVVVMTARVVVDE